MKLSVNFFTLKNPNNIEIITIVPVIIHTIVESPIHAVNLFHVSHIKYENVTPTKKVIQNFTCSFVFLFILMSLTERPPYY